MSTITQGVELFNIFAETYGKEKAQVIVKDIESIIDAKNQELATKVDLRETELRLTKEIEEVRSNLIKWVVGLTIAQISITVTLVVTFLK